MAFQPLTKAIAEARKPLRSHAKREILPFDIAGRNLIRFAAYYVTRYGYYLNRRIAARRFGYGKVSY